MGSKTKIAFKKRKGCANKGTKRRRGCKKRGGGTSFNEPLNLSKIPSADYIPRNENDEPNPISSRILPPILGGGKKRRPKQTKGRKGGKGKKVTFKKSRRMKGGSLTGTDLVTGVNTTNSNDVLAFGTTGGTDYMYDKLSGSSIPSGAHMQSTDDMMVPLV